MAMNKYMHPRNIYRNPPDFAKLASTYAEFSNIAKTDVTGKVSIDFKNPLALRILTKCLLKVDFDLEVEIPEDRLVPTLPLRLNYILWLEDILSSIHRTEDILGIDIGTGACAIYPLLAAVKNKWHMVATETDRESMGKADDNIKRNHLQEFITLKYSESSSVIDHLLSTQDNNVYDFCMCNPPFYSSVEELCESRSIARPQPKNAFTGSPQELITKGGELEFIRSLISESKVFKNKIIVCTTMVGHKYNLKELLQDLKEEGIFHTHTEFCQGRVTRWGLAWTFQDYNLYDLIPPRDKPRKKTTTVSHQLPLIEGIPYNIDFVTKKLKLILNDLKITYKIINKRVNSFSMDILAKENTWSNQRRKRRLMKRVATEETKKAKLDNESSAIISDYVSDGYTTEESKEKCFITVSTNKTLNQSDEGKESNSSNIKISNVKENELCSVTLNTILASSTTTNSCTKIVETSTEDLSKPMTHAFIKIFKKGNDFMMEMEFLNGSSGKEGLHQIGQYIKNNWK